MQERQRIVDSARGLARPVPGDQDRLAEVAGKAGGQGQDRDADGGHELIKHIRRLGGADLGVPRDQYIRRTRGLGEEGARITLRLLPDGVGPFAADPPKGRPDPLRDLPIRLELRFDQVGPDIDRGFAIKG
jgi:hypothetical protein